MKLFGYFSILIFSTSLLFSNVDKKEEKVKIGIEHDQRLGEEIAMDAVFTNSDGKKIKLADIIDKPTVLSLVYYDCPGICSPLLTNLGEVMDLAKVVPGEDYQVLSVSFDPNEGPKLAEKWKKNYYNAMERKLGEHDWRFLTGDTNNIKKLTESVGFYYQPDGMGDFTHSGALIVISPEGKITRYLLGIDYNPFDFKMAIVEASKGIATPPITKVLAYCFSYDPDGGKYVFNINKVAGTVVFLGAGLFLTIMLIRGKRRSSINGGQKDG